VSDAQQHITAEAKTILSDVITRLEAGEHIVVTSVEQMIRAASGKQRIVEYAILGFAAIGVAASLIASLRMLL